jgi:ubiquinone/menaquinone biosynthesis C-methylase UbiE
MSELTEPKRPPYDKLAPYYDRYTHLYQAQSWTRKLAALAEEFGLGGKRLLDVGCGTGKSFLPMLDRGWDVVGCDLSPAMLEIAKEKVGPQVRLEVADMRQLPRFGSFDLVWALNDAVNNLRDDDQLTEALAGMARNLASGGVVLFDLNTAGTFQELADESDCREIEGQTMIWTGLSPNFAPGGLVESRFEIAGDVAATHIHRQRHFSEERVIEIADRIGLSCLGVWGDFEGDQDQPLNESRHQKAIYILRTY